MERENKYMLSMLGGIAVVVGIALVKLASPRGTLYGNISDASGAPLAGAMVRLWHEGEHYSGAPLYQAFSNTNGYYRIGGIIPGVYDVVFSYIGYVDQLGCTEIVANQSFQWDTQFYWTS